MEISSVASALLGAKNATARTEAQVGFIRQQAEAETQLIEAATGESTQPPANSQRGSIINITA